MGRIKRDPECVGCGAFRKGIRWAWKAPSLPPPPVPPPSLPSIPPYIPPALNHSSPLQGRVTDFGKRITDSSGNSLMQFELHQGGSVGKVGVERAATCLWSNCG